MKMSGGELLIHLLRLGNETAEQNRYSLEDRNVSISRQDDGYWKIYYARIPPPGKGVVGGDLKIIVDADNSKILRIEKGR